MIFSKPIELIDDGLDITNDLIDMTSVVMINKIEQIDERVCMHKRTQHSVNDDLLFIKNTLLALQALYDALFIQTLDKEIEAKFIKDLGLNDAAKLGPLAYDSFNDIDRLLKLIDDINNIKIGQSGLIDIGEEAIPTLYLYSELLMASDQNKYFIRNAICKNNGAFWHAEGKIYLRLAQIAKGHIASSYLKHIDTYYHTIFTEGKCIFTFNLNISTINGYIDALCVFNDLYERFKTTAIDRSDDRSAIQAEFIIVKHDIDMCLNSIRELQSFNEDPSDRRLTYFKFFSITESILEKIDLLMEKRRKLPAIVEGYIKIYKNMPTPAPTTVPAEPNPPAAIMIEPIKVQPPENEINPPPVLYSKMSKSEKKKRKTERDLAKIVKKENVTKMEPLEQIEPPKPLKVELSSGQRKNIEYLIAQDPKNVKFDKVETVITALNGQVRKGSGSRRKLIIDGETRICLHEGHGHDKDGLIDPHVVEEIKKLLTQYVKEPELSETNSKVSLR